MVRKSLFGGPEGYAVRASKTFRTVSEEFFSETQGIRRAGAVTTFADPRLHYMQVMYFDVVLLPTCVCENDI